MSKKVRIIPSSDLDRPGSTAEDIDEGMYRISSSSLPGNSKEGIKQRLVKVEDDVKNCIEGLRSAHDQIDIMIQSASDGDQAALDLESRIRQEMVSSSSLVRFVFARKHIFLP